MSQPQCWLLSGAHSVLMCGQPRVSRPSPSQWFWSKGQARVCFPCQCSGVNVGPCIWSVFQRQGVTVLPRSPGRVACLLTSLGPLWIFASGPVFVTEAL